MTVYLAALLIGGIAGLRTMTAPAAVSWAAYLGWIELQGSWLSFLGSAYAAWILAALALAEFVGDQLPSTPSRKVPPQFGARIVSGGLCGAALGAAAGTMTGGAVAGCLGAVVGTLAGAAARSRLAAALGSDRPAGLIEDAVAVVAAALVLGAFA